MSPVLRSLACCSLLAFGCKSGEPPRSPDAVAEPGAAAAAETGESATAAPAGSPGAPPAAPGAEPPPDGSSPAEAPPAPGPAPAPGAPEKRGPPLPELRAKSFGLHVGGAARDAAARDDFLRALERNSWRYLECYQLIEKPGSEGTFGADLHVGGQGGKPSVSGVRTKLKGAEFRSCMERALESTKFDPTPSGRSVVVSYSLKFSFAW
jgi:hypothetical protein